LALDERSLQRLTGSWLGSCGILLLIPASTAKRDAPAFGGFGHRPEVLLEDDLLGGGRTHHVSEPAPVGRGPRRPALVANVLAQQEGLEPLLGRLEIPERILAGPAEVPNSFVLHLGDVDRRQIPAAHEPGQRDGVAAVGLDPITGLARDERGGDDVAGQALPGQVAVEPVPAGAGRGDEHERRVG